jgi:hypothetical protein
VVYYRFPGLIDEIMTLISKFGNLPLTCPILKGNYFLKDFHMDPDSIAFSIFQIEKSAVKHLIRIVFWDENARKPVQIFKFDIYTTLSKNKK